MKVTHVGMRASRIPDRLLEQIYPRLRAIGRRLLRVDGARGSFDATEVVHIAVSRACRQVSLRWRSEDHLVRIVARVMRQVLIDEARRRARVRPDALTVAVSASRLRIDVPGPRGACRLDLLALHEALQRLELVDSQRAEIAEARIFGGASFAELAARLGVTTSAVEKRFAAARAWLVREASGIPNGKPDGASTRSPAENQRDARPDT